MKIPREVWSQYLMALILLLFYLDGFTTKVLDVFQLDYYGFVTALSGLGLMPGMKIKVHRIFPVTLLIGGLTMVMIGIVMKTAEVFQKISITVDITPWQLKVLVFAISAAVGAALIIFTFLKVDGETIIGPKRRIPALVVGIVLLAFAIWLWIMFPAQQEHIYPLQMANQFRL